MAPGSGPKNSATGTEKIFRALIKCVFFFLGHDVFYLCFSSSARIDFSLWREKKKKNSKKKRTSGQVRVDKYCPQQSQRKRRIETGGEGKFFSFKVVFGGTSLFIMNHGPAGLNCLQLMCRFYWSTGAAEGIIMVDSRTNLRGRVPKKVFVCDRASCCGQNVDLDRDEGAGGPTIARSLSCARSFAMSVSARPGERGRANSKKRQKRSAQVDVLFFFFSLHCETVAC